MKNIKEALNLVGKYVTVDDVDSEERDGKKAYVAAVDTNPQSVSYGLIFVNFDLDNLDADWKDWFNKNSPIWPYAYVSVTEVNE